MSQQFGQFVAHYHVDACRQRITPHLRATLADDQPALHQSARSLRSFVCHVDINGFYWAITWHMQNRESFSYKCTSLLNCISRCLVGEKSWLISLWATANSNSVACSDDGHGRRRTTRSADRARPRSPKIGRFYDTIRTGQRNPS